jgi:hypothetical protein
VRARVAIHTEQVARGGRRTSAPPPNTSAALLETLWPPHEPHLAPPSSATRRTSTPREGPLYAALTAGSRTQKGLEGNPQPRRREG